jgi:hypothetical protein
MKKLIVGLVILFSMTTMLAEMMYDPVNDAIYTLPADQNISQDEYRMLIINCIILEANIREANQMKLPSYKEIIKQCKHYLKQIGTPTALRLITDLKKNKIIYPDGSFMRKIAEKVV